MTSKDKMIIKYIRAYIKMLEKKMNERIDGLETDLDNLIEILNKK